MAAQPDSIGGAPTDLRQGEMIIRTDAALLRITPDKVFAKGAVEIDGSAEISGNLSVGTGATGSFTTPTGQTVTVQDGIVTNIF
jgi:hypothetical protein